MKDRLFTGASSLVAERLAHALGVMLRSFVVEYATKHLSVGPAERLFARRPSSRARSDVQPLLPGHPADAGP
jgi:hypothetical protein